LDLDAWINDPPSESEDESMPTNSQEFFPDRYTENSIPEYQKTRNYVEPTTEELEKQRETRKQSEQTNPFYLKDTKKTKSTQQVLRKFHVFLFKFIF